jgi:tetratricopeptide (TPR) repeat protein
MREFVDFAAHKLPLHTYATRQERIAHSEQMLLRALLLGTTVAMIGSGMTVPFGYPTWTGFAIEILEFTRDELKKTGNRDRRRVERMLRGAREQALEHNALMFLIGACKEILLRNGPEEIYYDKLKMRFSSGERPGKDAFGPLLNLPINRFVTTNYDCEIERALICRRGLPSCDFGLDSKGRGLDPPCRTCRRSFTQREEALHQLALFSLAGAPDNENMVFHCHGRFDDPKTIIATEEDYQYWYLRKQDAAALAFQQNIELLLGSNPLLFVGYGLGDEDLLRPLRELVAVDPAQKGSRPIFALLESKDDSDAYHFDALFDRFGLHVIPYPAKGEGVDQRTAELCRMLGHLKRQCNKAKQRQPRKPRVRQPLPDAKLPDPHLELHPSPRVQPARLSAADALLAPGVTVFVGPSGSGKTAHMMDLLQLAAEGKDGVVKFDGAFYWNAHYANETITGIDYALGYFDPEGRGSQHERILRCLRKNRYLLAIDGCERLLRRGDRPGAGDAYSVDFRRLLRVFADPRIRSTVLLAGRDWPADLDPYLTSVHEPRTGGSPLSSRGRPTVRRVEVPRLTSGSIRLDGPPFSADLDQQELSALFSLLEGHHYGLDLASRYLKGGPRSLLLALNQRLTKRRPDERLREMLLQVLSRLDGGPNKGLASEFLETLSLFLNPICETTLILCYAQALQAVKRRGVEPDGARADGPKAERNDLESCRHHAIDLCLKLVKCGLLVPVGPTSRPAWDCRIDGYTVHTTARRLLFQPSQGLAYDPLPAVGLSGFTAGRTGVAPDRARCDEIQSLFKRLLDEAKRRPNHASRLCRDAFGLLRTRMEANTVPRWATYDEYLPFGIRIAQLAKRSGGVSGGSWTFCEPLNVHLIQSRDAPLYAAELAWLYNDLALALSAEGSIADACGLWDQALEISRLLEDSLHRGSFHLEILLSLTFTSIEMGRLPAAQGYLEEADRILLDVSDDDSEARVLGLRGLIAHLGGDLQAADGYYDRCLHLLRSGTNLRAQSIFLKHKADVKITTGDWDQADLLIRNSRALAEAGIFPELIANARISEGHRLFRRGDPVRARLEYHAVLKEAQRIGIRKLETRALTALARLALDQKDVDSAHAYALRSLRLANEMGLGLRQTHGLVVLGLATLAMELRDLGIALLRHAKRLADSQEYWARSREAENKLQELNVDPNGTEYPAKTLLRGRG